MSLPTLLKKDSVVPSSKLSKKEKELIANTRGIDYIINFMSDRVNVKKGILPKIKPKKFGDKVLVLKSMTGSGKSTVLPPTLYESFQDRTGKNIAVTQPRIMTAISISTGLPEFYPFLEMDKNLGYSTSNLKRMPTDKGIIYMTVGTLLQQLKVTTDEEFMKKYSFILIDEVHDRSVDTDMSLFLLKKLLVANFDNPECPFVIMMSATFNPKTFMKYFECPDSNYIEVSGMTFPIEAHFAKFDVPDYIKYAVDMAEELHIKNIADVEENSTFRDILIFVQGAAPLKQIIEKLNLFNTNVLSKDFPSVLKYLSDKKSKEKLGGTPADNHYYIAPIALDKGRFESGGAEYQNLFSDINDIVIPIYKTDSKGKIDMESIQKWVKPKRRVIVSTNIAETGVTIDTLKYCIDTGWVKKSEFNPDFGVQALFDKNVTRGMSLQRKGRVGRKSPGLWYPCYTEKVFNNLQEDQFADILTADITDTILSIIVKETDTTVIEEEKKTITDKYVRDNNLFRKQYFVDSSWYKINSAKKLNFSAIDFLETPSANTLNFTIEKLYGLGMINTKYEPTTMGFYGNLLRKIPIEAKRMIFAGFSHGAHILDLITIAAFLMTRQIDIYGNNFKPFNLLAPKVTDADFDFYKKIVIGCEFTKFLLIWEHYSEFLGKMLESMQKKKSTRFSVAKIKKWCEDRKIKYEGLLQITATRNEIIESLISLGINPYYNGLGLDKGKYSLLKIIRENLDDGLEEIKKIKKCILDGYRFNLVVWDDTSKKYMLHHRNIPVQIIRNNTLDRMGDDAVQRNANFIILSSIMVRDSQKNPGMFDFVSAGSISIMDQYLDIDLRFLMN